jgi:uncharacterized repeat protein (TIGR03806 family)
MAGKAPNEGRGIRVALWIACGFALCACGGGADTVENDPAPSTPPTTPPPQNPPPGPSGLDARPSNTTCLAPAQPNPGSVALSPVFSALTFTKPILMLQAPGDTTKWYVVEQDGVVRTFANDNSVSSTTTFIDIDARVNSTSGEAGLLGMAFDRDFATSGRVYLSYTANPTTGGQLESRISRFTMSGSVLNPASEEILLTIEQPFTNHNGGNIAFGPDGMLYAGFGDGGSGGDPQNNAQNRSTLLGKMLRIDVRGNGAYTIPADNPYATTGTRCQAGESGSGALCAEIYAYGFRNPWRWTFDRGVSTPDLWLGDVGQNAWEEVDRVEKGGNYGWRFREGAHCFNPSTNCPITANGAPLIDPVAEYGRDLGGSITGGYVYRGTAIASLVGRYVFADFGSGRFFVLVPGTGGTLQRQTLLEANISPSSFGEGHDGELYVIDYGGKLYKLVFGSGGASSTIKTQLSQTGCFDPANPTQPAAALIPYAPSAPFWSDGASKARWMAVPDGQKITVNSAGDWEFPNGTVLVKNFTLNGELIETRLFMRHSDTGNWAGYTYRWNASHTDATLVTGGLVATIGSQQWVYPSEAQCLQCHTPAAGGSLGLETRQLNTTFTYPSTGRSANQLDTLEAIGLFTASPARVTAMPDPADTTRPVGDRARAYLHTNCAQCHRPGGGAPGSLDLQYTTAMASTGTCNADPASGDLGVAGAKIIAPGDASRSVLYLRMNRRDAQQMPPVGSLVVDTEGVALMQQWISGLSGTCQ